MNVTISLHENTSIVFALQPTSPVDEVDLLALELDSSTMKEMFIHCDHLTLQIATPDKTWTVQSVQLRS
jgi:hypothetical protein